MMMMWVMMRISVDAAAIMVTYVTMTEKDPIWWWWW